ncbi:MAG TPA: FtsX-like permease family protein, partial [Protaetiibacter sp.]|nr:FtsX-like permease family protein [Protaetiibacter sp.]
LGDGDSMHEVRALPGAWVEGDDIGVLHSLVLPPDALGQIDAGLQTVPHAVVAAPSTPWTSEQEDALVAQVEGVNPDIAAEVERAPDRDVSLTVLALVGSAGILALAATWIASGLAAVESRADLATLAAVGAAPRVRRRVAGLQSAFLTATGVLPGLVGGLAVGWALVSAAAGLGTEFPDPRWQMVVPWSVLAAALFALPLIAGATTALFPPAKLPLVRRTVE